MSLYGVHKGVSYGQHERVDELNERIQSRQFSDKPLAPNFSSRPVLSKYSRFPIIDRRAPVETPIQNVGVHNVENNFSPATHNGPPGTYFVNVDVESGLRNQTVALSKGIPQGIYVPNSDSDLYKVNVISRPGPNPHPKLFDSQSSQKFRETNVHLSNIGKEMFHNHTRNQLREL